MAGTLLEITYHLNELRSKSVTIGHDPENGMEAYVWLYKCGDSRIRMTREEFSELIVLKEKINEAFVCVEDTRYSVGPHITLMFTQRYGKRLMRMEFFEWPVQPTNVPKSATYLWFNSKMWECLVFLAPLINATLQKALECSQELKNLFDTIGYHVKFSYGTQLRKSYGDLKQLKNFMDEVDSTKFLYKSPHGLDVSRAILEIKTFCLPELRDFVENMFLS